jgi:uncharacterized protein (TIGR04255 family)
MDSYRDSFWRVAMIERPSDLPDFDAPPITEVALGVQFNGLDRFLVPHFGAVWQKFRDEFPVVNELLPIPPVFETFGPNPQTAVIGGVLLSAMPPKPRVTFTNQADTEVIQIQQDHFLVNWKKNGASDQYPRFESMLDKFRIGFDNLSQVVLEVGAGDIIPNQCEVAYINQIPIGNDEHILDCFERVFGSLATSWRTINSDGPEDVRILTRYVMRDDLGTPRGRLTVSAEPARRPDGTSIIQVSLMARGMPTAPNITGVIEFLLAGRRQIVTGFTNLTSPQMHEAWERKQ